MSSAAQARYRELYSTQRDQRLYAAPWWLDSVCGPDGWDAIISDVLVKDTDHTIGLPFFKTRIRGLTAHITPPLTQWVDVLDNAALHAAVYSAFLNQLPPSAILDISLRPGIDLVPTPRGYRISSQYSYVLPPAPTPELVMSRYNEGLRQKIKQAPEQYTIDRRNDVALLVQLYGAVFRQKKLKEPWWIRSVLPGLIKTVLDRGQGEMRFVIQDQKVIAGSLVVWDDRNDYYLVGGREPGEGGMSAHAFLLHDAIVAAGAKGHDFDFEGSMVPGIASFFQTFGAKPLPFTRIRRYRGMGRLWSLLQ